METGRQVRSLPVTSRAQVEAGKEAERTEGLVDQCGCKGRKSRGRGADWVVTLCFRERMHTTPSLLKTTWKRHVCFSQNVP